MLLPIINTPRPRTIELRLLWCIALITAFGWVDGCDRTSGASVAYDHARQTFIRGDLVQSEKEAEKGSQRFSASTTQWGWKFKILQAQSLLWQSKYPAVLTLLDSANLASIPAEDKIQF